MISRRAKLFAVILGLAGCSPQIPDAPRAKEAVAAKFGYPSSVEFRKVRAGQFPHQVCGEAKGRDVDGVVTDFRRFSWQPNALTVEGFDVARIAGNDDFNRTFARVEDLNVSTGCNT